MANLAMADGAWPKNTTVLEWLPGLVRTFPACNLNYMTRSHVINCKQQQQQGRVKGLHCSHPRRAMSACLYPPSHSHSKLINLV
jgi:hypothetical protein